MTIRLHRGDLADLSLYTPERAPVVAIDTETLGLNPHRDRLCVVQLSPGDGTADVVQIPQGAGPGSAPNLERLLADPAIVKLFHFGRFDIAVLSKTLGVEVRPVWCTKIASKLSRTYTDRHGLKELVRELLGIDISKQQQSSDWAADDLTEAQLQYAASDVLYLHATASETCRHAGARGPYRACRCVLRFPADPRRARSRRLAGGGYFRAFVSPPCNEGLRAARCVRLRRGGDDIILALGGRTIGRDHLGRVNGGS